MDEEKKIIPVGVENFELLRKEGYYYVDKTNLVQDLLKTRGSVNLFTRPRRFGKTLTLSMLKSFFEIGTDKSIFEGLTISKDTELCEKYMGKYPVISISLKGVDALTFERAYQRLANIIRNEVFRLDFLIDSDAISDNKKQSLRNIAERKEDLSDIESSLQTLSILLERYYGQKVILLIDEYDVPLDKAYQHGYYEQMIDLIRSMLGAALKTNDSLFFAVLTGCMRISSESIFAGLNNLKVYLISNLKFDEYFGFTDQEVGDMLSYYNLEQFHEQIRKWYYGYHFGNKDVYCPWDVLYYCDELCYNPKSEPQNYWMNTSGNDIIRRLIEKASGTSLQVYLEDLIAGKTISIEVNEQLTYNEIENNIDNIWSLLYMTGYLTTTQIPSEGNYILRIPNLEIRNIFNKQVKAWFKDKVKAETDKLVEMYEAFEKGDTETITTYLNKQLITTMSYHDEKESFYHGFLSALFGSCSVWKVLSNRESGTGRGDLIVKRIDNQIGLVIEIKNVQRHNEMEEACTKAINQIEDKQYVTILNDLDVNEIWIYGIAFCKKSCKVAAKRIIV